MVTTVVTLLIQFLPVILQSTGVITPTIEALIVQLGAAIPGLITSLAAGKGATADIMAVLTAFQSEIQVLRSNSILPATTLELIDSLNTAITAAVAAYTKAQTITDPSTLTPLPTSL